MEEQHKTTKHSAEEGGGGRMDLLLNLENEVKDMQDEAFERWFEHEMMYQ